MPAQLLRVDQALSSLAMTVTRSTAVLFPFAEPESLVISLFDPLLVHNREILRRRVVDAIDAGDVTVVLDIEQCAYIDAAGLGALVSCAKRLEAKGGSMTLCGVNEDLMLLMQLTKLDTVLRIVPSVKAAA
jgi:anti-sigma B factor antagonist